MKMQASKQFTLILAKYCKIWWQGLDPFCYLN